MVSFRSTLETAKENVVRIEISMEGKEGNGSGILIDDEGTLITCEHVVRPEERAPDSLRVRKGAEHFEPEILRLDRNRDIAILRVEQFQGQCSFKGYDDVEIGEEGFVLGYPLRMGHLTILPCTISAKGEYLISDYPYKLIQIGARVNRGNSGGPVIDSETGNMIGIVTMKYIPFFQSVDEVRRTFHAIPEAPEGGIRFGPVDWWAYFNLVNESLRRLVDALMLVQVGIGWVIPSDLILENLESL